MANAPSPQAILRGHKAQVHATTFIRHNERLVTGDADGFVILWDLAIMRPATVWRAHENAILGIQGWGEDKLITHGRDHKLIVWKIQAEDEERLSSAPPLEEVAVSRPVPWILHLLEVNTMNFCSFSACPEPSTTPTESSSVEELLIAVPNTLSSDAIDIWALPRQTRIHTISSKPNSGMAMCLSLFAKDDVTFLVSAFENGSVSVHRSQPNSPWIMTYQSQSHSQPVLSLAVHPSLDFLLSSSADSLLVKHPIPSALQTTTSATAPSEPRVIEVFGEQITHTDPPTRNVLKAWNHPIKSMNTKHSGQQSLRIRSDGKIFATAGWDTNVRVYSCKTMKELAVLQWHKVGCYTIAFSIVDTLQPKDPHQNPSSPIVESLTSDTIMAPVGGTAVTHLHQRLNRGAGLSVKESRISRAKATHWVAAGSKDGKVSLWDIY